MSPRSRDTSSGSRRRIAGERRRPHDAGERQRRTGARLAEPEAERTGADEHLSDEPIAEPSTEVEAPAAGDATAAATVDTAEAVEPAEKAGRPWSPPRWLLAVLAVLVVAVIGVDAWLVPRYLTERRAAEELSNTLSEAPPAAEEAAVALLSYRWDAIDDNISAAGKYAAADYRSDYTDTMRDLVQDQAKEERVRVRAQVVASGVIDTDEDRCDVLLFVNQTTNKTSIDQPNTALNRTKFTMIKVDGRWLVDDITAY